MNRYGPVNHLYRLLWRPSPLYKLLWTCQLPLRTVTRPYENPYPPTNHYGPINRFYGLLQDLLHLLQATTIYYKLLLTRYSLYRHTTLHSMVDISKQINKGREK